MIHLLTGAGSGIGAELAGVLHRRGDELVLLARSDARAEELAAAHPGATTLVADLADAEGLERALAAASLPERLDSLVHAAGVVELGPVNLTAPFLLTRALLPALRAARGQVVFVNSGAGLAANASWAGYAASKFGLRALADALRSEEQDRGVRVTTVFPGRVATAMQEKVHRQEGREYDAGAWIRPETVADLVRHVLDLPPDATVPEVRLSPTPGRVS